MIGRVYVNRGVAGQADLVVAVGEPFVYDARQPNIRGVRCLVICDLNGYPLRKAGTVCSVYEGALSPYMSP